MRFTSIASGSSGNCTYIGTERTHLLVDAGVTAKAVETGLNALDLSTKDLSGILVTHEHSDHIKGLGVIARKYGIPMYGTVETLREILLAKSLGEIDQGLLRPILPDEPLCIGDVSVRPFSIAHDAANPVGYRLWDGKHSVAVATDLGHYDAYIKEQLTGLSALLLEANHDPALLWNGSYPMMLKRRILSDFGHLSNESAGKLLSELLHDGLKQVFLGHLSRENNEPMLALETVRKTIDAADCAFCGKDFPIALARRDGLSEVVVL